MHPSNTDAHYLALDIGEKRVGVAIASEKSRLARPLMTLPNDTNLITKIKELTGEYNVQKIIVGLPKSLSGLPTNQTIITKSYMKKLKDELRVEIDSEDEALSSVRAEEELKSRGKIFSKAEIDKLAACLILEDYLNR